MDQVELRELVDNPHDTDRVLNGIAVHPETKNLLVTGKWWDKIYEISWK